MPSDGQDIPSSEDHELFTSIAKDIKTKAGEYQEAGKWLDEYCSADAYWQREEKRLEELEELAKIRPNRPHNEQEIANLKKKLEKKEAISFFKGFSGCRNYWVKKYQDGAFVSELHAKIILLITWLLSDPDVGETEPIIAKLQKWGWEPTDDILSGSRSYASCIWCQNSSAYEAWMKLVRTALRKLEAAREENVGLERSEKKLLVFPDIIPSSIRESRVVVIEDGDISTKKDLNELTAELFKHPEWEFEYYHEKDTQIDEPLKAAKERGEILMPEAEFFHYKHPKLERNYVHIEVRDGKYRWEWEKEVVEKGPMFARIRLELSERKKRELEIAKIRTAIAAEEITARRQDGAERDKWSLAHIFLQNLLRSLVKHLPFGGSFLDDVIYGTLDSRGSQKKTTPQTQLRRLSSRFQKQKAERKAKGDSEKWYQSRTIQAALIGIVGTIIVVAAMLYTSKPRDVARPDPNGEVSGQTMVSRSLREICEDIDSRPLLQQEATAKNYIGINIEREQLKLFDIHEYTEDGTFQLIMILPDQSDVSYLVVTGRKILCTVNKAQYPELTGAKKDSVLLVSGQIESAGSDYIQLSDVSLSFD